MPREFRRATGTISAVSGTATYSLASDVLDPKIFRYAISNADYFLEKIDSEDDFYKHVFSTAGANSLPKYYFDAGVVSESDMTRRIIMHPTPDRSITINYSYYKTFATAELTTAELASAIPGIPAEFHNAVWKGGLYYFLKAFDDPAQQVAKGDFAEALAQIEVMEFKNTDKPAQFKLRPMQIRRM